MKVEGTLHFGKSGRRKAIKKPRPPVRGRIPRIAKLMACYQDARDGRSGEVADYAELAVLAQVSRARMTQIMNLNRLSLPSRKAYSSLPPVESGRDAISLRALQSVCLECDCERQALPH